MLKLLTARNCLRLNLKPPTNKELEVKLQIIEVQTRKEKAFNRYDYRKDEGRVGRARGSYELQSGVSAGSHGNTFYIKILAPEFQSVSDMYITIYYILQRTY